MDTSIEYPGGSKNRVNKAGNNIRSNCATPEDYIIVEQWRAAHRSVLNTFQALLRTRTKNDEISVAQRHKRRSTIFDKLQRFQNMQLSRMDDVAGCRLIFHSIEDLYLFRSKLHSARFKHKLKNEIDRYDYIKKPKQSGYRGIHDIYTYDVSSKNSQKLRGLYIEIQYRTLIQHAWATAVEVVGFITENKPKFQQGDTRYVDAMSYASELLARAHESRFGPFPDLKNQELIRTFNDLDHEIGLLSMLGNVNQTKNILTTKKNTILMFSQNGELEHRSYRDATDALKSLFELEKLNPDKDIVLVRADKSEDIRLAFRNYFSDAKDFLILIEEAKTKLSQKSKAF